MYHILIFSLISVRLASGDTYSVKIGTENHVNVIDNRFLSFSIDPKYLFSSNEKYASKECICMASSLTPAYIRIAGPSTAYLAFHNTTITIDDDIHDAKEVHFQDSFAENLAKEFRRREEVLESRFKRNHEKIEVSHKDWRKFIKWAESTGFDLVFALNNEEKMDSGMWDPNTALNILTVAEKAKIGDIFWQLGYECNNQSIEEYLNDLETLRVILETFAPGRAGQWSVVGGDVSGCLQADSKSDFKDYITLSNDMMDAVLLNGNSSTHELDRMSDRDRLKLLRLLSHSTTPLWLTESRLAGADELAQAADWLAGLGHAARNGFSAHFRELDEEIYHPTLSFYMSLLFKNLVGSKVLDVSMDPDMAIMFAHCTSLRHKAVPGAVTLYAVNLDEEPARFSIKLDRREEGGDIMQFILGHDHSGNIQVNGKSMYFEGDLKPVVKRVRPYKTLLIHLPAKSFGFWVLANTKINACYDDEDKSEHDVEAITIEDENETVKSKRSVFDKDFAEYANLPDVSIDFFDDNDTLEEVNNTNLKNRITDLNKELNKVQELFKNKTSERKVKRQINSEQISENIRKLRRQGLRLRNNHKGSDDDSKPKGILANLIQRTRRNITRLLRNDRTTGFLKKSSRLSKNKVSKRNSKTIKPKAAKKSLKTKDTPEPKGFKENNELTEIRQSAEPKGRSRRSVVEQVELSAENNIEIPNRENAKLWKVLKTLHKQLKDLSEENEEYVDEDSYSEVLVKSKEDKDDSDTGLLKSTIANLMRMVSDLNNNLNRFWDGIHLLD